MTSSVSGARGNCKGGSSGDQVPLNLFKYPLKSQFLGRPLWSYSQNHSRCLVPLYTFRWPFILYPLPSKILDQPLICHSQTPIVNPWHQRVDPTLLDWILPNWYNSILRHYTFTACKLKPGYKYSIHKQNKIANVKNDICSNWKTIYNMATITITSSYIIP